MRSIFRLASSRLLPALLTALGVVLITGGLLSYADPNTVGTLGSPSAELPIGRRRRRPSDEPAASPGDSAGPGESPTGSLDPNASPPASIVPDPTATPDPTKRPGRAVATRVVVPALNIDLPIVKGNDGYPLCNVAMYLHTANTRGARLPSGSRARAARRTSTPTPATACSARSTRRRWSAGPRRSSSG